MYAIALLCFLLQIFAPAQAIATAALPLQESPHPTQGATNALPKHAGAPTASAVSIPELQDLAAARAAAWESLRAQEAVLGCSVNDLRETLALNLADTYIFHLEQWLDGLPVLESRVEVRLSKSGEVLRLQAAGLAPASLRPAFSLCREEAGELALAALSGPARAGYWVGSLRPAIAVDEQYGPRPAWQAEVFDPLQPEAAWSVLLDAKSGAVLKLSPATLSGVSGIVDGVGMASGPQTSGVIAALPLANLYVSALDRAAATGRLTDNDCNDLQVALSADGSTIAWTSLCDGDQELWVAAADGSNARQLTDNAAADHSPTLSADGSEVVFVSDRDGDEELYHVHTDGSGLRQLTVNDASDREPSLSGDASLVVYVSEADGDAEVSILELGSLVTTQVTFNQVEERSPKMALLGTHIAWLSRLGGDSEVWVADSAGNSALQISFNSVEESELDLAPDGSRVVFSSRLPADLQQSTDPGATRLPFFGQSTPARPFRHDLFEAATDGSSLRRLTSSDSDEREPAYAANGSCLAYSSTAQGNYDIEILDLSSGLSLAISLGGGADRQARVGASCMNGVWVGNDGDQELFAWGLAGDAALATTVSDGAGVFTLPFADGLTPSVTAKLNGPFARVADLDPRWGNLHEEVSVVSPSIAADLHFEEAGNEEGPVGQVTAWACANLAHDVLAAILRRPPLSFVGPLPFDKQLELRTQFPVATPNAFYSPANDAATFFIGAGALRPNTAYDSLVLHEYGHFFDDQMGGIGPGSDCEGAFSLSEGIADTVSLLVLGDPRIAVDFYGPGTWLRHYDLFPWEAARGSKGRQYDCIGCTFSGAMAEAHEHGEAFAGLAWDLRSAIGPIAAENLLLGALASNPGDMQAAVSELFFLAATPAFGGSGNPSASPYSEALYTVAARHGFDGPPRADLASYGCAFGSCPGAEATHRVIGTEWLGDLVFPESLCEPLVSPENDGLDLPATTLPENTTLALSVKLQVNPALKGSGRYGAPLPHPQVPERRLYLNVWLLLPDGNGGFQITKVLGTGSGSGILGPDSFEPGIDAVAFNPDTWAGTDYEFSFSLDLPEVEHSTPALLRLRLDYGEDVGRLESCLSDDSLSEMCGTARFGEVEDYQIAIIDS